RADVVLDCTDNKATRQEINAACVALNTPLISASAVGFGGQLMDNPSCGVASDKLIRCGGSSILSETTEFIGAEHVMAKRAVTPEV
ncbi:UxaA family hydrolase, partial [Salmonella enterica subsp. enterica serovar Kentucky]|nr:UxaA family hydrolase [Salmonella enterica subsp. enterica serovar Kentucky]